MMAKIKYWLCWLWDLPLAFVLTIFELIDYECLHHKNCAYKPSKSFTENLDDAMNTLQDIRNKQHLERMRRIEERLNNKHSNVWK